MYPPLFTLTLFVAFSSAAPGLRRRTTKLPPTFDIYQSNKLRFSGITAFGDSFSDNGSLPGSAWELTHHQAPADPAYYAGTRHRRYSNGPVWIEDLADGLGIPLTDYAVGGATANNALIPGLLTLPDGATFTPPSAADQVKAWSEQLHQDEKAEDISDELFVIFIGANDGFNAAAANLKNQGNVGHIAMDGVAHAVVSNIEAIIKTIQVKGGKHFLLATYPDLSKIPLDQEYSPFSPEFVPDLLTYTNSLRSATQDLVRQLQANHVKVTLADIYLLGNDILAHPMTYGFERTDVGCVVGSFPTRTLCSEDPKVQNTYAFWDHVHPTTRGHRWVASYTFGVLLESYEDRWGKEPQSS